jgi:hypothetical protein
MEVSRNGEHTVSADRGCLATIPSPLSYHSLGSRQRRWSGEGWSRTSMHLNTRDRDGGDPRIRCLPFTPATPGLRPQANAVGISSSSYPDSQIPIASSPPYRLRVQIMQPIRSICGAKTPQAGDGLALWSIDIQSEWYIIFLGLSYLCVRLTKFLQYLGLSRGLLVSKRAFLPREIFVLLAVVLILL